MVFSIFLDLCPKFLKVFFFFFFITLLLKLGIPNLRKENNGGKMKDGKRKRRRRVNGIQSDRRNIVNTP